MEVTSVPPRSLPRVGVKRIATAGGDSSMATEQIPTATTQDDIQRWTARRRIALVLSILKGEVTAEESARRHGLAISEIEDWKERMLMAAHNALRSRPRDEDAMKDEQIRRLKQKVGELVLDVDLLKEALQTARSHGVDTSDD
jgi:hypothetical protein